MISVIIPYNKDRGYLKQAVESVLSQSYKDYELILSDGEGSLGKNVNDGVKRAKGKYIKILAEDDKLPVNSLQDLKDAIGTKDWVCGAAVNFYRDNNMPFSKFLTRRTTLEDMLIENDIHGGTTMYKKSLWKKFGGWDEDLKTAEEYDWHLKLLKNGVDLAYTDKIVHWYRLWTGSKSGGKKTPARMKIINEIKNRYR